LLGLVDLVRGLKARDARFWAACPNVTLALGGIGMDTRYGTGQSIRRDPRWPSCLLYSHFQFAASKAKARWAAPRAAQVCAIARPSSPVDSSHRKDHC
jgi:hypothetical protein